MGIDSLQNFNLVAGERPPTATRLLTGNGQSNQIWCGYSLRNVLYENARLNLK